MRSYLVRSLILGALSVATLAGCSGQRPLHRIKADAEHHLKYGRFEEAQADYEIYLAQRPDSAQTRYELAQAYMATNQPRKAIRELQICTDVYPLNDDYLDLQANAMYQAGDRDALVTLLTRQTSERQRPSDYLRLGTYQGFLGNADEAEQALLTAAKLDGGQSLKYQRALVDFYKGIGDTAKYVERLRFCYYLAPLDPAINEAIRAAGEIPGPTFGRAPVEMRAGSVR